MYLKRTILLLSTAAGTVQQSDLDVPCHCCCNKNSGMAFRGVLGPADVPVCHRLTALRPETRPFPPDNKLC